MNPNSTALLARIAYTVLLGVAMPVYLGRLWWRGKLEPLYRRALGERLGFYKDAPSEGWVWVHAVSLGETRAAAPLVDALRALRPGMRLLLTHSTATGFEAGADLLREGDMQAWLPYDLPGAVRRFFRHFEPTVGVLMETEIWPHLLFEAEAAGIPMVLANARLSLKSFEQGQTYAPLMRPAARCLDIALAQTEEDAQRLRESGVQKVLVCGNLKYDLTPSAEQVATGARWRRALNRSVLLGATTRDGEENQLLQAWSKLPEPRPMLLIVPRHPQRFEAVIALVRASGFLFARRSNWKEEPSKNVMRAQIWIGDSMQEMPLYYACANVALLGGSFAPLGGHNLIEAAACGCPLIMGPSTFNFAEAAELSLEAGASVRAADMSSGVATAMELLAEPGELALMASRGLQFTAQHRGAASRMAQQVVALLPR